MRHHIQEIIKSARIQWTPSSIPVLHTKRYKYGHDGSPLFPVSHDQMDPHELFAVHPVLSNPKNDAFFMDAVQALWKRNYTNKPHLRSKLTKKMSNSKFSITELKDILKSMIQFTPPQFQLDVLSVKT